MAKKETAQAAPKKKAAAQAKPFSGEPRLKTKYKEEVVSALNEKFKYENVMQIPKLEKIILNMGLGSEKDNPKGIEKAVEELSAIAGQKAVITKAKKSVANFKVREGMNIGAKVTLRGDRMYYFADKLMNIVLPRVRDFRGVSDKSFDGRGNYAMGVREQLIFPEINYDDVDTRHEHRVRYQREERRGSQGAARTARNAVRSGLRRNHYGKDIFEVEAAERTEVLDPRLHPLPDLRSSACGSPQVRHLPRMLPRRSVQRQHPRRA